jgi:hypothetical protein
MKFIATTDDPHNFIPGGHFTPVTLLKLDHVVLQLINAGHRENCIHVNIKIGA